MAKTPLISRIMSGKACPYCRRPTKFKKTSDHLYNRDYGPVWECEPCEAWVGCHPNSKRALGRIADKKLRLAKQDAHAAFDPLWKAKMKQGVSKRKARKAAYKWLSEAMNIPIQHTHIGMFDAGQCQQVVRLCMPFHRGKALQS